MSVVIRILMSAWAMASLHPSDAVAQTTTDSLLVRPPLQPTPPPPTRRAAVPFELGEELTYIAQYGPVRGSGSMTVLSIDTLRGSEVWHTALRVEGGIPGFRVRYHYESWFDTRTLFSLRHVQDNSERGKERKRVFEIFPESAQYRENEGPIQASVPDPLDDAAFFYWVRTIPLEVGVTYSWDRYFRPDRNPVRLVVMRRERIQVPAGEFETIVVQPIIKSRGVFSEGGEAILWLSDDEQRRLIQMRTKIPRLPFGSITLKLKTLRPRTEPDTARSR